MVPPTAKILFGKIRKVCTSAAVGTPGGHTIPQKVAQIIINLIDFDMNMQEAIDVPKLAFFEENSVVCTESGISKATISSLKEMGHIIDNDNIASYIGLSGKIGHAMGIKILRNGNDVSFDVGIDKRKDGWSNALIDLPRKRSLFFFVLLMLAFCFSKFYHLYYVRCHGASDIKKRTVHAIQDIKAGDEILIDYNYLDEPEYLKEDYYKRK